MANSADGSGSALRAPESNSDLEDPGLDFGFELAVGEFDSPEEQEAAFKEAGEMLEWAITQEFTTPIKPQTLWNKYCRAKQAAKHNNSLSLEPPHGDKVANDYNHFVSFVTSVSSNIDTIRKKLRYHVNNPNLLSDLKINELRKQLDEIEARATQKVTSEPHKNVHPLDTLPNPKIVVADTTPVVARLVDCIFDAQQSVTASMPVLFIACEGINLGSYCSLTLLQIYVPAKDIIYIVDVQALGMNAFTTTGINTQSNLKTYLESTMPIKAMWDCRSSAESLYADYAISLAGVIDVQLAENATNPKPTSNKDVLPLVSGVEKRINLPKSKITTFSETICMGKIAMEEGMSSVLDNMERVGNEDSGYSWVSITEAPCRKHIEAGSSISATVERPLNPLMEECCAQTVVALPMLLERCYRSKFWNAEWEDRVKSESATRLRDARSPRNVTDPKSMYKAPRSWIGVKRIDQTRL